MSSSRTTILRQGRRGSGIHFQLVIDSQCSTIRVFLLMNYQPTYRTGPKVPFQQDKCEIVLKEVIDSALEEYQYSAKLAPTFSAQLADEIVKRVKELGLDRWEGDLFKQYLSLIQLCFLLR